MNSLKTQKNVLLITFLFIPVLLLLVFVVYPTLKLLQTSFTSWDGFSEVQQIIGFKNYKDLIFNSKEIWVSLKNNFLYFIIHLGFIPLEIIAAVILNSKLRGMKFFKSVVFMPYIINGVAVAYAFSFFFSPVNGALNEILKMLSLEGWIQNWLSNPSVVNYSLVSVSLWRYSGFHIVLFLAALQSIPEDIIEAAVVDGANAFKRLIFIILPSIKIVVELMLFLNLRGALQVFDIPFVITQGGPGTASSTFALSTIQMAFKYKNFGMASTMGISLIMMIVVFNWVQKNIFGLKEGK
jgi:multiple sugar transport system permease protein